MESYPKAKTAKSATLPRCCNLDWLEVHCREPELQPRDSFYYEACGYRVHRREYGTRVYREMFSILAPNDEPLLEVRRDPASQGLQGIHDANECHIRLTNRTCYFDNAAALLQSFLNKHGYFDVRLSRVDICLDFSRFDFGDNPASFVRRYFRHRYAKINQGRICSHGADTWLGQEWNSLSWGSKTSAVTTKMYDKTMELYDVKMDRYAKPYIREAWFHCGLIDDIQRCTLNGQKVTIWRVEFSLRSAVKNWVKLELNGNPNEIQSIKNTLDCYDGRERILTMFASLARHYFRFKKFEQGKRKDRCEDKVLFDFSGNELVYKIGRPSTALGSGTSFKDRYQRLLHKLREFQQTHSRPELFKACEVLISAITEEGVRSDLANPWDPEELETLKLLLRVRTRDKSMTYDAAIEEVRKLLKLNKNTLPPIV